MSAVFQSDLSSVLRRAGFGPASNLLDDHELAEMACEGSDDPLAAIKQLLGGIALVAGESASVAAAVAAIEHYHLPNLLESLRQHA
ncbi:MAG: hypothetical protein ACK4MG_02125 [Aquabacterium sp.]